MQPVPLLDRKSVSPHIQSEPFLFHLCPLSLVVAPCTTMKALCSQPPPWRATVLSPQSLLSRLNQPQSLIFSSQVQELLLHPCDCLDGFTELTPVCQYVSCIEGAQKLDTALYIISNDSSLKEDNQTSPGCHWPSLLSGHTAGSYLAFCLPQAPGLFQQSSSPRQSYSMSLEAVIPSQAEELPFFSTLILTHKLSTSLSSVLQRSSLQRCH